MSELEHLIIEAHNKHYETFPTGLLREKDPPNVNIIYHLYSTGEITFQKGGWAYQQRSEFSSFCALPNHKKLAFTFPKKPAYGPSYVILTEEECIYFRTKMFEFIQKAE
jgi:hypothetical protein